MFNLLQILLDEPRDNWQRILISRTVQQRSLSCKQLTKTFGSKVLLLSTHQHQSTVVSLLIKQDSASKTSIHASAFQVSGHILTQCPYINRPLVRCKSAVYTTPKVGTVPPASHLTTYQRLWVGVQEFQKLVCVPRGMVSWVIVPRRGLY